LISCLNHFFGPIFILAGKTWRQKG